MKVTPTRKISQTFTRFHSLNNTTVNILRIKSMSFTQNKTLIKKTLNDPGPHQSIEIKLIILLIYKKNTNNNSLINLKKKKKLRKWRKRTKPVIRGQGPWSKAWRAALTAKSTSSLSPSAIWAITSPFLGSIVSNVFPLNPKLYKNQYMSNQNHLVKSINPKFFLFFFYR